MNKNLTEIVAILDRSGSMRGLQDDTIGGFNGFIDKQKEEAGEANLTVVLFDDQYEVLHEAVDIKKVRSLNSKDYYARGMTSLLDAVGKTITSVGGRLAGMNEEDRPHKVIFLITTDGDENNSQEYTADKIKEMVKLQEDTYKWEFIFLGANIDSFGDGAKMGYSGNNTANYSADAIGTSTLFRAINNRVGDARKGAILDSMSGYMKTAEDEA